MMMALLLRELIMVVVMTILIIMLNCWQFFSAFLSSKYKIIYFNEIVLKMQYKCT